MTETEAPTILIVDDDVTFAERLARAFRSRGYEARVAHGRDEAVALASADSPEYAVVDLRMPTSSGLDVVRSLKALDAETNIVVLTGYGSIATALEAVRLGATHYLTKPSDIEEILRAFERAEPGSRDARAPEAPTYPVASLARAEWEHIQKVLTDCEGNISQAAKLLGLHRRSLQRKLLKYPVAR